MARSWYEDPANIPKNRRERNAQRKAIDAKIALDRTKMPRYYWQDSSLDKGSEHPFVNTFGPLIPEPKEGAERMSLKQFIEHELGEKPEGEVWRYLEVGGPSRWAARSFSEGLFDESFGMVLIDEARDNRTRRDYEGVRRNDRSFKHKVIEADGTLPESYEQLTGKRKKKKFKFIMERLGGGFARVPVEPYSLFRTFNLWYEMLDEGGIILAQTPVALNPVVEFWIGYLMHAHGASIEARFAKGRYDATDGNSALFLKKKPGAPQTLPPLPPGVVSVLLKNAKAED